MAANTVCNDFADQENKVWCTYWTLFIAHTNSTTEQKAPSEDMDPATLKDPASHLQHDRLELAPMGQ